MQFAVLDRAVISVNPERAAIINTTRQTARDLQSIYHYIISVEDVISAVAAGLDINNSVLANERDGAARCA